MSKTFQFPSTSSSTDEDGIRGTTNPLYAAINRRKGSIRPQPKNTILYEVKQSDTVSNIAARHDTTPSELMNLNRLGNHMLYPGQILYVPTNDDKIKLMETLSLRTKLLEEPFPKPGHVERMKWIKQNKENRPLEDARKGHRRPSILAEDLNKEALRKSMKLNVKYITDGEGVVPGTLLITPNHLLFDPNVSDPLVMEHGLAKYSVIAPMSMVARAALYPDIVRMRLKSAPASSSCAEGMALYKPTVSAMSKSHTTHSVCREPYLSNLVHFSHSESEVDKNYSSDFLRIQVHKPLSSISESLNDYQESHELHDIHSCPEQDIESRSLSSSSSHESLTFENVDIDEKNEAFVVGGTEEESMIHKLEAVLDENGHDLVPKTAEVKASKKKKSYLKETAQKFKLGRRKSKSSSSILDGCTSAPSEKQEKRLSLDLSAVAATDERLDKTIPRPAKSYEDGIMYLCLKMGCPLGSASQKLKDFGNKIKQEYWFGLPKQKADHLYWFVLRWVPEKYGDIADSTLEELGFAPIPDKEEPEPEEESTSPPVSVLNHRRMTWSFPWKLRKSKETKDSTSSLEIEQDLDFPEVDIYLPELKDESAILKEDHIRQLNKHVPARLVGASWKLIYNTALHGFSLHTMYREMAEIDSHILIVIENSSNSVFGAVLSEPLRVSDHFYGTGESFLFTFYPEFKCFPWTGENNYVIKGNTGSFAIGASDGQFGLWLDDDLFHGCTKSCQTFNNICLSEEEDFFVKGLEAWYFL